MPIRREPHITREMVREHPDWLFCFGDNLARKGLGGQAREMRGEPNAVGIPTKRAPSMRQDAFLTDADTARLIAAARPDLSRVAEHLIAGGVVVWPWYGIGTGLAELETRAPYCWAWLQDEIRHLECLGREYPSPQK